jgi:hypothetical protein
MAFEMLHRTGTTHCSQLAKFSKSIKIGFKKVIFDEKNGA